MFGWVLTFTAVTIAIITTIGIGSIVIITIVINSVSLNVILTRSLMFRILSCTKTTVANGMHFRIQLTNILPSQKPQTLRLRVRVSTSEKQSCSASGLPQTRAIQNLLDFILGYS